MKKYIIKIYKGSKTYTYGREWKREELAVAADTLLSIEKLNLIESYYIKEVTSLENINFY